MDAMQNKGYTYEDYCTFNDDQRREVINGVIYLMTAPLREHQEILSSLNSMFWNYLRGKRCKVFPAAFDVRLPKEGETKETVSTIVQPDIVVVCDKSKLDKRGCFGAPDLVIEILSPSTGRIDKVKKLNLYQQHGVMEYWIVDPYSQTIDRFSLNKDTGEYKRPEYFGREDTITPVIFPDLTINLTEVFPPLDEYEDE
jgi:Uma2 family endonuclease